LTDELLKWRSEFPILEKTVYLISHSLGAMPKATYDSLHEYADMWATRGVRAWAEGWWDMPITIGDEVGRVIGADPGTVVMHQNVSICQSLILSCIEPTPERNKIVYSELNFPSVMYVYEAHARDGRLRIETVKSDDGITVPLERMLEAIDEQTLLVPFSHVLFKSAFLQDAKAITGRAHEVGARVVLDTYQSAGTVPFSVKELNVDFATGGSVKWLCGGPGAGYLYVRPDLHEELTPKTTGWMAHASPFSFETELRYATGIARFLHGSPAIPALFAARPGYKIINELGVDRIRAKSVRQTGRLIQLAQEAGFKVTSPKNPEQRGGTITVWHEEAAAITRELIRREFIVDFRPGAAIEIPDG
jgi:kynureninase